jgi:hypothetical protein
LLYSGLLEAKLMATWTIESVPEEWNRLVERYATEHGRSKNQELLDLFGQALQQRPKRKRMTVEQMRCLAEATAALPGPSDFEADAFLYGEDGLPK